MNLHNQIHFITESCDAAKLGYHNISNVVEVMISRRQLEALLHDTLDFSAVAME